MRVGHQKRWHKHWRHVGLMHHAERRREEEQTAMLINLRFYDAHHPRNKTQDTASDVDI